MTQEYMSYNALSRRPMMPIFEVPYMFALITFCSVLLISMLLGVFVSPWGWLFFLIEAPIILFARFVCETDDRALDVLWIEVQWLCIRFLLQSKSVQNFFGGTLTLLPIDYSKNDKSTFE